MDESIILAQLGEDGLRRLVAAFYRQVPGDDILGPMYPAHELAEAEKRLADFMVYRFGGSDAYIRERGHPRLRGRHMAFAIDENGVTRWLELMRAAMKECGIVGTPAEAPLWKFFVGTAMFMQNREAGPPTAGQP